MIWLIEPIMAWNPETRSPKNSGSGSVSKLARGVTIALHVEFAIVLMRDPETESFVEPQSGVDLHHGGAYCSIETYSLIHQPLHNFGTDTLPLKRTIHKELCDKKFFFSQIGLQPARGCRFSSCPTVARYYADPLLELGWPDVTDKHGVGPCPVFGSFLGIGGSGNLIHLGCDLVEEGKAIFPDEVDVEVGSSR
jgi:hypothetical protein